MSNDHGGMQMPMPMPGGGMNTTDSMSMQMSFFWGKNVVILFVGWPDNSLGMYILALLFVFLLAAGVEVLSILPIHKPGTNPMSSALIQAIVYALRMGLAYLVMLSVMSYNLGIFLVAVVGHALGFYIIKYRAIAMAGRAQDSSSTPKV